MSLIHKKIKLFINFLMLLPVSLFPLPASAVWEYPSQGSFSNMEWLAIVESFFDRFLPLQVSIYTDRRFTPGGRSILEKATTLFINNALNEKVIDCAYSHSTRDLPVSREDFVHKLLSSLYTRKMNGKVDYIYYPGYLFIDSFSEKEGVLGVGFPNYFYHSSNPSPGYNFNNFFYIGINIDYLEGEPLRSPEFWSGVIAHEILHNLGYHHPNGTRESFINEYGECLYQYSTGQYTTDEYVIENRINLQDILFYPPTIDIKS